MKNILIYSPYWKTKGGGERYALTVAECLQKKANVWISIENHKQLSEITSQLGIKLNRVNLYNKMTSKKEMSIFDGVFWVSDGSIPLLTNKVKVIHFQAPFRNVSGKSIKNKIKLLRAKVVCNSKFTKGYIDKEFEIDSKVIYPPVEVEKIIPQKKEKLILTVGRFSTGSQHKKPEVLVESFRKMVDGGLRGWRMAVVGIVENEADREVAKKLRVLAKGYPIAIRTNLPHRRLMNLYARTTFYWHAAGYGIDLSEHPERAEHFGISTVEAMAGGAVPMAFEAGGQKEIITSGENGVLWKTTGELIKETIDLINDSVKREIISKSAIRRAGRFSKEEFCHQISGLFL